MEKCISTHSVDLFFLKIQPYVFNMQVGDWIEKIKLHKSFEFLI